LVNGVSNELEEYGKPFGHKMFVERLRKRKIISVEGLFDNNDI
tara:strand:- start:130 stop:258 length:129 start_codon:yes stop_codon:yes gene_type:complete